MTGTFFVDDHGHKYMFDHKRISHTTACLLTWCSKNDHTADRIIIISRNLAGFSLGRSSNDVVVKDVAGAPYGESDPVLVVLKEVTRHIGVERLHHR